MGDLEMLRGLRRAVDTDRAAWDVHQATLDLDEEMVVVGDVGIEIRALPADGDLAQQTCALELMQRIVDGCQRDPLAGLHGLLVQDLGRDVAVALAAQQRRPCYALPRRPPAPAP